MVCSFFLRINIKKTMAVFKVGFAEYFQNTEIFISKFFFNSKYHRKLVFWLFFILNLPMIAKLYDYKIVLDTNSTTWHHDWWSHFISLRIMIFCRYSLQMALSFWSKKMRTKKKSWPHTLIFCRINFKIFHSFALYSSSKTVSLFGGIQYNIEWPR